MLYVACYMLHVACFILNVIYVIFVILLYIIYFIYVMCALYCKVENRKPHDGWQRSKNPSHTTHTTSLTQL